MSASSEFLTYCIELYATEKNLYGKDAYNLFETADVIDYILRNYEALHTVSDELLIEYIGGFIRCQLVQTV